MVTFGKTPHEVLTLTTTPPTPVSCSFVVPQTKGTAAESTCVPSISNLAFCDKKLVTTSTELHDVSFHLVLKLLAAETHQRADLQAALAQRS